MKSLFDPDPMEDEVAELVREPETRDHRPALRRILADHGIPIKEIEGRISALDVNAKQAAALLALDRWLDKVWPLGRLARMEDTAK